MVTGKTDRCAQKKDWKEKKRKWLQSLSEEYENMNLNDVESTGK